MNDQFYAYRNNARIEASAPGDIDQVKSIWMNEAPWEDMLTVHEVDYSTFTDRKSQAMELGYKPHLWFTHYHSKHDYNEFWISMYRTIPDHVLEFTYGSSLQTWAMGNGIAVLNHADNHGQWTVTGENGSVVCSTDELLTTIVHAVWAKYEEDVNHGRNLRQWLDCMDELESIERSAFIHRTGILNPI